MVSSGSFNWVLVALSAVAAAVGIAAWVRHRGTVRLFLALTALLLTAVFLVPTLLYAPFSGEQRVFGPEAAAELERVTRTVYEIVPVLLVLILAMLLVAVVFLLLKKE
ncbi:MAG TPA: hypothetical protein VM054_02125 [bacterium]|nr:hypothetical protein [bacterium]